MQPSVQNVLQEARQRLEEIYGDRLVHVIVYGSHARGDAQPDCDVDVMVVLREQFELYPEIKRLSRISMELLFRYGVDVSFQPYEEKIYHDRTRPFIMNVHEDGVML